MIKTREEAIRLTKMPKIRKKKIWRLKEAEKKLLENISTNIQSDKTDSHQPQAD